MIFNFQLFKIMQYNTQQKRMPLPEYGRSIQNMVDYALTIQDRAERQRCANTIINMCDVESYASSCLSIVHR